MLFVVCQSLVLFVVSCLLFDVYYVLLFVGCYLLFAKRRRCSLFVVRCVLCVV